MRVAIDHKIGHKISIEEFIMRYGNDASDKGEHAICPVCRGLLFIRGNHNNKKCPHFAHARHADCIVVRQGKEKYSHLTPVEQNPQIISKRKADFLELTDKTYIKCHTICDKRLKFTEYYELLRVATNKKMWSYRGLELECIPYILLTYCDLTKRKNRSRNFNLRFVFNSDVKNYSDLWIKRSGPVDMIRLSLKGNVIHHFDVIGLVAQFNEEIWLKDNQRESLRQQTSAIIGC